MAIRLADVEKALGALGISVEETTRGSHKKLTRPGSRPYPLPCHNGKRSVIPPEYIGGLCRHFGIDRQLFLEGLRDKKRSKKRRAE